MQELLLQEFAALYYSLHFEVEVGFLQVRHELDVVVEGVRKQGVIFAPQHPLDELPQPNSLEYGFSPFVQAPATSVESRMKIADIELELRGSDSGVDI